MSTSTTVDQFLDATAEREGRGTGFQAGGASNLTLSGPGDVAIATGSSPLTLRVTAREPLRTDPAAVLWSRGLSPGIHTDVGTKSFLGRRSGEEVQMEFSGDGSVVIQSEERGPRL